MATIANIRSLKPRQKTSQMWNYFVDIGDSFAKCNICKKKLSFKTTTANLKKHLRSKHKLAVDPVQPSDDNGEDLWCFEADTQPTTSEIVLQSKTASPLKPPDSRIGSKKAGSQIWSFFTNVGEYFAECNICKRNFSFKTTTANLKKHLQRKHRECHLAVQLNGPRPDKQTKRAVAEESDNEEWNLEGQQLTSTNGSVTQLGKTVFKKSTPNNLRKKIGLHLSASKYMTEKFMNVIICDLQPCKIVEDKGFRSFVSSLNPSYKLPTKQTISNTLLPTMYEKCYNKCREMLKLVKKVCLSTDSWTSRNSQGYVSLTAHFIDDNFELRSIFLDCFEINDNEASSNIATNIRQIMIEWELIEKVFFTVSDNAGNIKNALSDELQLQHFECFAHTLNFIVDDALSGTEITELINRIRIITFNFTKSNAYNQKLIEYQQTVGKEPLKLMHDSPNRWTATYFMIRRLIELEDVVKNVVPLLHAGFPILTHDEWECCHQLCEVLKPFEKAISTISEDKYTAASLAIPLLNGFLDVIQILLAKNYNPIIQNVVAFLQSGFISRFSYLENSEILAMSTFLDPRFKAMAFKDQHAADNAKKLVIDILSSKFSLESSIPQVVTTVSNELSIWNSFQTKVAYTQPKVNATSEAVIEVQRYEEADFLVHYENPLNWWKIQGTNFSHLAEIVRDNLSAVATSVPCKRLYSQDSLIFIKRRAELGADMIKIVLFLNSNWNQVGA